VGSLDHRRSADSLHVVARHRRAFRQSRSSYDMLPADAGNTCDGRTAANNATVRTVFVVGPDKKIKLMLAYPMSTGRNFDEVLRVLDSIQLTATPKVATPGPTGSTEKT
jgi:alkyl hydroperoxide reductase subunit AhpC